MATGSGIAQSRDGYIHFTLRFGGEADLGLVIAAKFREDPKFY
jgi:hypothetical protein